LSSKLRKLKQQAYEAGRKRDWAGAAEAYARILEQDKNNPSLQNEYGDVCLRMGDITKAVRQFLAAASKYQQTGLLNNAQAVYKKVLRHEPGNLNANWFLAEIRAAQGLIADGVQHTLTFLAAAEEVSGEIKEVFLKRCLELFTLYPESDEVLAKIEGIFRLWKMPLETARAGLLRACVAYKQGEQDAATAQVAAIVAATPEIVNYAEHTRWLEARGQAAAPAGFADVNTISLGDGDPSPPAESPPAERPASDDHRADQLPDLEDAGPATAAAVSAFEEFLAADGELETRDDSPLFAGDAESSQMAASSELADSRPTAADVVEVDRDEEGCISIDVDGETSFAELIDEATGSLASAIPAAAQTQAANPDTPGEAVAAGKNHGSVNLLAEILAEEGADILRSSANEQVSTIASEIGRNLGQTEALDPESQYQQGLVYLELGLYDQAIVAFTAAAAAPPFRLRAREMWGIALHRAGEAETALAVLREGLAGSDGDSPRALGLRYHAGRILEELDRQEEAQAEYRRVHAQDAGFADVVQRLRTPVL
jgi:tetratricopeptide (TPR) repeat protein